MATRIGRSRAAHEAGGHSLPEAHRSIRVWATGDAKTSRWRKWWAFAGPGFMVSVGYMDPGNWGTDLAGGSQFGYALLWVVLASNLIAIFLQVLCARLGIVTGRDLAQACRDYYPRPVAIALWLLCELAIVACDLAEVVGSAVALNLLLGLPLAWGVLLTGLDVLLLLALMQLGFRKLEAVVVALIATIALCFGYTMLLAKPDWNAAIGGALIPSLPDAAALLVALGILGATVMPHNLYLHSAIVQTRAVGGSRRDIRAALAYNAADTVVALGAAFFVNAAILVLAAAVFWRGGIVVDELQQAHELLRPALGGLAATAFAIALLASGQSSTITGTLAGQVVMEGFLHLRIAPWLRRLATRALAVVPALVVVVATGGRDTVGLLVVSQVVLSMQLPFAIFPLVMVTSSAERMGEYANRRWVAGIGYLICFVIAALNLWLLWQTVGPVWVVIALMAVAMFSIWSKYTVTRPPRLSRETT